VPPGLAASLNISLYTLGDFGYSLVHQLGEDLVNYTVNQAYLYAAKPVVAIVWIDKDGAEQTKMVRGDDRPIRRAIAKVGGRIVEKK
jgi:hypothetical protein